MDNRRAIDMLQAAAQATAELGLNWHVTTYEHGGQGPRPDFKLQLKYAGLDTDLAVEVKTNLRPATLGIVQKQLQARGKNALLVADYINPQIGDELRKRGVQFIDTAGNVYLNQPPLLVWITGRKPNALRTAGDTRDRAFQPTGLKVLFALLCQPDAVNRPYRDIAEMAGVAHGTVGWVMPELPKLGFLIDVDNRRRLVERERLLDAWTEAYARRLRPKLPIARYQAADLKWTEKLVAPEYGYLLGGEPAVHRMQGHLRPGTATLYGDAVNNKLVADYRLRPDPAGNVEIMKRFWNFQTPNPGLVPPILVYADLLATGDARCFEAAQELYGGIVDRLKQ